MSDWVIEPLTSTSEIDEVVAIEEASFTNPWTRDMYLAELENRTSPSVIWRGGRDRMAIGFCSFWHVVDELHINNLAVLPEYRRRGVATALLGHVLDRGRSPGCRAGDAGSPALEQRARVFCTNGWDFVVAGVRHAYYSKPVEDAIILWCEGLRQLPRDG